jgi:hypothetical protein
MANGLNVLMIVTSVLGNLHVCARPHLNVVVLGKIKVISVNFKWCGRLNEGTNYSWKKLLTTVIDSIYLT